MQAFLGFPRFKIQDVYCSLRPLFTQDKVTKAVGQEISGFPNRIKDGQRNINYISQAAITFNGFV